MALDTATDSPKEKSERELVPKSWHKHLDRPSMSVEKVDRKGKLDHDLPFRYRQTFAIFPNRSCGWGKYARFATLSVPRESSEDEPIWVTTGRKHLACPGTQFTQQVSKPGPPVRLQ